MVYTKITNYTLLVPIIIFLFGYTAKSQTVPTPQDCMGAIPVCKEIYTEPSPYKYQGEGNYPDEIYKPELKYDTCITEEIWGVWYVFTAQSTGNLRFQITPDVPSTDYDWIVFDFTQYSCPDFGVEGTPYLSSNNYGSYSDPYEGLTGANSDYSMNNGNCDGPGDDNGRIPWNDDIPLQSGRTYLLYISNWSRAESGYVLDFSGSTAKIFDDQPPEMNMVNSHNRLPCGENRFTLSFTENIRCDSVSADKFKLTDGVQNYEIMGIFNPYCSVGVDSTKVRDFEFTTVENLPPGYYSLIFDGYLTDACGNYTEGDTIDFEVLDLELINKSHTGIRCFGHTNGTISLSASDMNSEIFFSIDNGNSFQSSITSHTFRDLSAGDYHIKIKNQTGCEIDGGIISLIEPPELQLVDIETNDITTCYGDNNGSIKISATGGTLPIRYSINNGQTYPNNTGLFEQLDEGIYTLKIIDKNNCEADGYSTEIKQPGQIEITVDETKNLLCYNDFSGAVYSSANGGTGNLKYKLNNTDYQISGSFENLKAGTYTLTVSDQNNCIEHHPLISIKQPDELSIKNLLIKNVSCSGYANASVTFDIEGGTPAYALQIKNTQNITIPALDDLKADKYTIEIEDDNNCVEILTVEIFEPEPIAVTETVKEVTCNGGKDGMITTQITGGTQPYTFRWSNDSTNKDLTNLKAGIYVFNVVDKNNCKLQKTITVTEPTQFSVVLQTSHIDCFEGNNGKITANVFGTTGEIFYTWAGGQNTQNINNLDVGIYEVIVTDKNTMVCAYATDTIVQPDSLKINIQDLKMSCNGTATGYIVYKLTGGTPPYNFTSNIPQNHSADSIVNLYPGNYILTVVDENQCETVVQQYIDQQPCEMNLRIPNIFTPNSDERNDVFKVSGVNLEFAQFEAQIFNRWGQKLLVSNTPDNIWNGKLNNGNAAEGVYYYVIKASALHGEKIAKKGFFVLKR